jgi:nucleotide-binding universal stress UspA family protein
MYRRIVVPVDIGHADKLEKALAISADLAKHYDAELHYVGVTAPPPSAIAHNPAEFAEKLQAFAAEQAVKRGVDIKADAVVSHDPVRDLDDALRHTIEELDADLVVMASHVPGFAEYIFASNAGYLASHANVSVLVVR